MDTQEGGPITTAAAATGAGTAGQPANPVSLTTQRPSEGDAQPGEKAPPGPSYESDEEQDAPNAEARLQDLTRSVKSHARMAGATSADEAARKVAEDAARKLAAERLEASGGQAAEAAAALSAAPASPGVAAAAPAAAGSEPPAAAAPPPPAQALVQAVAAAEPQAACGPDAAVPAAAAQAAAAAAAAGAVAGAAAAHAAEAPKAGAGGEGPGAAVAAAPAAAGVAGAGGVAPGGGMEVPEASGQQEPTFEIDLDIDLTKGDLKVDYSTRGLLGQGGFAAVYKGRYKGERVAVKMIKKTAGSSLQDLQEDMNALMHELHILRQVKHPNIVTLYGGCLKPPHIFLVEERMEGTLDFYVHQVRKNDPLSVREVVYFALDIACGLSYLHPRIVHRDLKPANVLLSREGRCKISDFGLARTKIKEYLSTKNLDAGTTAYIAPECFMSMDNPDMHDLRRSVTDRTDIYALAIIMWEMLASKRPWQGLKPLLVAYQVAYRSLRPPLFELGSRCPPKLRHLIEDCWCQEPKRRPSSQQVVDQLLEILNELPPEQDEGVVYAQ